LQSDVGAGGVTGTEDFPTAAEDSRPIARARATDYFVCGLLALSPFLFALASWNPSGERRVSQALALTFSLPVTVIEIVVILYGSLTGFSLAAAFRQFPRWAKYVLAALVVIAIATAAFADNPIRSSIRTWQLLIHLAFGFVVAYLFQTRWAPLRGRFWAWTVAGTSLYVVATIAWVLAVQDDPDFNWIRFSLGVVNIRQTGFYSTVGAAAALGLAAIAQTRAGYWTAVAAASLMTALTFWSGTRGALVAVVVAFAAASIFVPSVRNWRSIGALVASTAIGAILSLLHQVPHPLYGVLRMWSASTVPDANVATSSRLEMWRGAIEAARERILFGYGESQFGVAGLQWSDFNHPHNILLQVLIQWGAIGFVCYFSLAAYLAWRCLAIVRTDSSDAVAPFLVLTALLVMSLYEGSLYHPYPYMMVVLAAAFLLSSEKRPRPGQ
jgi:O-antigen ligase